METAPVISAELKARLLKYQRVEETDRLIYLRMAAREKNGHNRAVLAEIADDEKQHAAVWAGYTGAKVTPSRLKVFLADLVSLVFGYTFTLKLMEKNEHVADHTYRDLLDAIPGLEGIIANEQRHEKLLAEMLDEKRLKYVGAVVLGLNDALVELTGALAGLSLALADNRLVALAGIITGASATLSMAASNYLAERAEGKRDALTSSLYTGVAYLITVMILIAPYLIFPRPMYAAAVAAMLGAAVLIILVFNYYISVAQSRPFWRRFMEMTAISLGVALLSFGIGLAAKKLLGLDPLPGG